jgi:hypothetical protein
MKKVNIHIGTDCKGSCKMCFEHRKPEKYNFPEYFTGIQAFIKENKPRIVSIFENRKSDPLSEKNLPVLVNWLAKRPHIKKINIITSGQYEIPKELKEEKKVYWGISIDGPIEFHEANRGKGSFEKSIEEVKNLLAVGQHVFVRTIASKTLFQDSLSTVKVFYRKLKKMGAKVYVQRYTSKMHRDLREYLNRDLIMKLLPKWVFTSWKYIKERSKCIDPTGIFSCPDKPILAGPDIEVGKILKGPCYYCGMGYSYDPPQKKRYKVTLRKSVYAEVVVEADAWDSEYAKEKALKEASKITDWNDEHITVDSVEVHY